MKSFSLKNGARYLFYIAAAMLLTISALQLANPPSSAQAALRCCNTSADCPPGSGCCGICNDCNICGDTEGKFCSAFCPQ